MMKWTCFTTCWRFQVFRDSSRLVQNPSAIPQDWTGVCRSAYYHTSLPANSFAAKISALLRCTSSALIYVRSRLDEWTRRPTIEIKHQAPHRQESLMIRNGSCPLLSSLPRQLIITKKVIPRVTYDFDESSLRIRYFLVPSSQALGKRLPDDAHHRFHLSMRRGDILLMDRIYIWGGFNGILTSHNLQSVFHFRLPLNERNKETFFFCIPLSNLPRRFQKKKRKHNFPKCFVCLHDCRRKN